MFNVFRNKKLVKNTNPTQGQLIWERFCQNKMSMCALGVLIIIIIIALFADVIADYESRAIAQNVLERMQPPSAEHWFGTDNLGRDLFARVIHGARYSMIFGIGCTALALFGGCVFGATAAYFGGKIDSIICRIMDTFMCIPFMLMALSLVSALGTGLKSMTIAMVVASVPSFTRMIRSIVLTVVRQDYIEAARSCGSSHVSIIFKHVLPNAMGPIIVNATMNIAGLILSAAGLSFIGMGIQPPNPEWGYMLSEAMPYMRRAPHLVIFPGLAIIITALCFNLLGDGLADAFDPKRRS
ncbi:MAG: ABC transporter permease [Clostridiales bacterium]|nr:ABC transporter permease [Clostridiales bacterium]MDD7142986.1 ABC transporter permease [bacterium]MDY5456967.1 ABC transporter permease [Bariatricus sp.]